MYGSGTVLDSRPVDPTPSTTNLTALFSLFDELISLSLDKPLYRGMAWHNDTLASDWPNYLIKQLARSPAILDPHAPVPIAAPTAALFSSVYSRTFAILLSLHTVWDLVPTSRSPNSTNTSTTITSNNMIPAEAITGQWRIFMNPTMYQLALIILSLNLAVAAWLYSARPKAFLPRMPTSLASVIASFAGGNAVSVEEQMRHLDSMGWKFGYGRLFPGKDGWRHMGIERAPFFEPVQAADGRSEESGCLRRRWGRIWRPGR